MIRPPARGRHCAGMAPVAWGDMGIGWLMWVLVITAYALGLVTGWVIWRLAKQAPADDGSGAGIASVLSAIRRKADFSANGKHDAPDDLKLAALDAEIKEAKAILEADKSERDALSERLADVDAAVKRANGRLKLVLKSIQNLKNNG